MTLRRLALVAALSGLVLAACSSGGDDDGASPSTLFSPSQTTVGVTIPPAELESEASVVTDLLVANKWAEAVEHFSPLMAANFNVEGLKLAWGQVEAQYGKYRSRGTTARVHPSDKQYVIFDTPMTFGTNSLKSRISFDASGEVAELKILESNVP